MYHRIDAFVDGGYVRAEAGRAGKSLPDPYHMCKSVTERAQYSIQENLELRRVIYYDGKPADDSEIDPDLEEYWSEIENLPFTELGFGTTREGTSRRGRQQKGVDTLLAVDMLVGSFDKLFPFALLVTGDADFVPVVNEVRRRGVSVFLAGVPHSVADDLRRACDVFIEIKPESEGGGHFPLL